MHVMTMVFPTNWDVVIQYFLECFFICKLDQELLTDRQTVSKVHIYTTL